MLLLIVSAKELYEGLEYLNTSNVTVNLDALNSDLESIIFKYI